MGDTTGTRAPFVLAFDTSRAACDVAVLHGTETAAHRLEEMAKGQAERLMVICHNLLEDAGVTPTELSAIGVGIGPGNFTGIRIAVSAARGLALGLGIPAIGVSAFDALRFGTDAPCTACIDARRDQVYVQTFDTNIAHEPKLLARSELGNVTQPIIGAGNAAPRYAGAVAIAHIARERMVSPQPRPAPLYLRPADAAPAKDPPPKMLS